MQRGLCGTCVHSRAVNSAKGSTFYLCEKGLRDPRFPKYPRLPVHQCDGWATLRPTVATDIPAIQAIYGHWVRNGIGSFELEPPSTDEMRARFDTVRESGLPYLVVETEGGVIAGYAYCTPYRPRKAYRFTVEDSVYIHPDFAGQGFGKVLLEALVAECVPQGYKQMIAVIGGGMENIGSVQLHARCGFEHAGVLKAVGYKFDRWLDTVFMQRSL